MSDWPSIDRERTRERLAMDDEAFAELALRLARRIGGTRFTERHYERAVGYPWHPLAGGRGFVLSADGSHRATEPRDRDRTERTAAGERLHPLVAIGSNAAPAALAEKLDELENPADREVLALPATLSDVKIGFSAHLAIYGSLPATLVHAPGERTAVTMLFVTAAQLSVIADGEFNYLLARFDAAAIDCDVPLTADPLAFVSRHGAISDGERALDLRATPQADALGLAARSAIGPDATAREIVRETIESYEWAVSEAKPRLSALAEPLDRAFWDLHPGG